PQQWDAEKGKKVKWETHSKQQTQKSLSTSTSETNQLQATNQETYFMMRIMLSLMAGKHLFSPHPLS
ncbi:hypothetical protein, partial [Escherichia coli]|uniref:hypothetical protein n=1 Tax=Escherichia coli TaxID=562 RepID=UPI001BC8AAE9